MAGVRFQEFFGDDWEETLDSLKSAPGAFGNILVGGVRQMRLVDLAGLALVFAGWFWVIIGYGIAGDHSTLLLIVALLPSLLWFGAGIAGGLVFEVGGIGVRSLAYWESYLLIGVFACFGLTSLRLALNPRDRRVYRAPAPASDS
ncbi:MAG TPA: hypothetical protein VI759_09245 [Dehalococcoidia bacterium]|nr:hypothetical protein [Dehalococcoidia bacterium]